MFHVIGACKGTSLRIKGNSLPYITAEARVMIKQRDYLKAKANRTGSKFLRQLFSRLRKSGPHHSRSQEKYYCKKIEENKDDMKGTWKILKHAMSKGNNATTYTDSIVRGNQTITDKKLMPGIFNDHFVNIGEKLANEIDETEKRKCSRT